MNNIYKLIFLFLIVFLFSGCINNDDPIDYPVTKPRLVDENASINTVGTEVAIGDEHFYVISSDSTTVTMLAKYNLLVGKHIYNNYFKEDLIVNEEYGLQSAKTSGYYYTNPERFGILKFSNTTYWVDTKQEPAQYGCGSDGRRLKSEYGSSYPAYVYNSNSNLYSYIVNYKKTLQKINNIIINDIRLIKYEELINLGCIEHKKSLTALYTCSDAPSWLYQTSYWTGSAFCDTDVISVQTEGIYLRRDSDSELYLGVRPVIVISKNLF